ncbi:MAG: DNA integrity scanning diadenylate cyclase DisA [archaeon]
MSEEKEKIFIDYLKKVSPGTPLRTVIDDILRSGLGALIIFHSPKLEEQKMYEGGFRVNCRFTSQKLFELCKMDGAIVISADLKRILYANVLMTPDPTVHTNETGTRHKAGERTAKQAETFAIAVSERKKKTTLYFCQSKTFLKSSDELLRDLYSTLQILEKQREILNDLVNKLNVLEVSELTSTNDVCRVVQRSEMMLKIAETTKRSFIELGNEGNILNMRYRELLKGVEKQEEEIIRDYSKISLKRVKTLLSNITFNGLLDIETISRLVLEKGLDEELAPRGYRFLSHLPLSEKEVPQIVAKFENLNKILTSSSQELEQILKNRASSIKGEINLFREQILAGKIV